MRPSLTRRMAAAALAGIFLLAGSADVYGLHHCPHHQHGPAHETPAPAGASAAEAGQDRADTGDAPHHGHDDEAPCTCVGSCHGSASAPVVAKGPATDVEPVATTWRGTPEPEGVLPDAPTPYLTPYPTGPPFQV